MQQTQRMDSHGGLRIVEQGPRKFIEVDEGICIGQGPQFGKQGHLPAEFDARPGFLQSLELKSPDIRKQGQVTMREFFLRIEQGI